MCTTRKCSESIYWTQPFYVTTGIILLIILFSTGCEEANYKGATLTNKVNKVVIFDIDGPGGVEFTRQLGTEINSQNRVVVYGTEYGEPADSISAAKITRDCGAQAFVLGKITSSGIVRETTYEVHGTFTLHDSQNGDQIGGIADALCSENLDILNPVGGLAAMILDLPGNLLGSKSTPNQQRHDENLQNLIASKKTEVYKKLARKVAYELGDGLGGRTVSSPQSTSRRF